MVRPGKLSDEEIRRRLQGLPGWEYTAGKLRTFWSDDAAPRPDDHGDWRARVDIALGARAWRPLLDLAMHGLETSPSPELYEVVKDRFAVVTSQRWMEGISYEEWLAER